jgi:replicative DNA helicase
MIETKLQKLSESFFQNDFMGVSEAIDSAKAERAGHCIEDLIYYPNSFLSDCLTGIVPGELIVVGADTGIGKSEFSLDLAYETACKNKNVYLFPLEGNKNESINRLTWRLLCTEYFKNPDGRDWNYKKFLLGGIKTDDLIDAVESKIQLADCLHIYKNTKRLNEAGLVEQVGKIHAADLIIIDHLHYLSLDESKNENAQVSSLVSTIKELTKIRNIPIVLVSHLRKKDRFRQMPDNEDFHGSSNIAKEADTCIMIFRDPDNSSVDGYKSSTLFRVTKSRDGSERRYVGKLVYSLKTRKYENEYELVVMDDGKLKKLDVFNYPHWAKIPKDENEIPNYPNWTSND